MTRWIGRESRRPLSRQNLPDKEQKLPLPLQARSVGERVWLSARGMVEV